MFENRCARIFGANHPYRDFSHIDGDSSTHHSFSMTPNQGTGLNASVITWAAQHVVDFGTPYHYDFNESGGATHSFSNSGIRAVRCTTGFPWRIDFSKPRQITRVSVRWSTYAFGDSDVQSRLSWVRLYNTSGQTITVSGSIAYRSYTLRTDQWTGNWSNITAIQVHLYTTAVGKDGGLYGNDVNPQNRITMGHIAAYSPAQATKMRVKSPNSLSSIPIAGVQYNNDEQLFKLRSENTNHSIATVPENRTTPLDKAGKLVPTNFKVRQNGVTRRIVGILP